MHSDRGQPVIRLPVLDAYLREQKHLTAVDRFTLHHEADGPSSKAGLYRDLIPLARPKPGQQYAFEVDLDACSGCRACVTACHRMNGLDAAEAETWRHVGALEGGTAEAPVQRTASSACHHCVDPACLSGCPVGAYEKDLVTGIVRHLDDQCIGCQYCTLTCPYEVPQFSPRLGIVRKCDMCTGRLEAGEEPACVEACPSGAIAIRLVEKAAVLATARAGTSARDFLPGAPSAAITAPTTRYVSRAPLPDNTLPTDFHRVEPGQGHAPLAVMLVLTQWSAGAFVLDLVLARTGAWPEHARVGPLLTAAVAALAALAASTLHLGRPLYAWRALLGLRTSWLSREVLVFGLFAPLAAAHAFALWLVEAADPLGGPPPLLSAIRLLASTSAGFLVAALGALGVLSSAMLYHVTRKRAWRLDRTGARFAITAGMLATSSLLTHALAFGPLREGDLAPPPSGLRALGLVAAAFGCLALAREAGSLRRFPDLGDGGLTELKRTALLLAGRLRALFIARLALCLGAVLLPLSVALALGSLGGRTVALLAALGFGAAAAGEIVERSLFFRAVSGPRMPGHRRA